MLQEHKHAVYDPGHTHKDEGHTHGYIRTSLTSVSQRFERGGYGSYDINYPRESSTQTVQTDASSANIVSSHANIVVSAVTVAEAGDETRPKNMAVVWIMRII